MADIIEGMIAANEKRIAELESEVAIRDYRLSVQDDSIKACLKERDADRAELKRLRVPCACCGTSGFDAVTDEDCLVCVAENRRDEFGAQRDRLAKAAEKVVRFLGTTSPAINDLIIALKDVENGRDTED